MVVFEKGKYIDGYLQQNMEAIKKAVNLKWDCLLFISGYEGDGKSTLAAQLAYYLDNSFNLTRVVFTPEQFKEACLNGKPQTSIVFDESYYAFTSQATMTKSARVLNSMLTMIRKKQLFIFIVAPTVFDMQKYIICHRSRALIHIYSKGLERGYFAFYNRDRKLQLYMLGKRYNNMGSVKPNFVGRFTNWFPLDEAAYDKKKEDSIQQIEETTQPKWSCPTCKSSDTRANKGATEVYCRRCGFVGGERDFNKELTKAKGGGK